MPEAINRKYYLQFLAFPHNKSSLNMYLLIYVISIYLLCANHYATCYVAYKNKNLFQPSKACDLNIEKTVCIIKPAHLQRCVCV